MTPSQAAILRQSGRRPLLPSLLHRRGPEQPRAGLLALAGVLFAAIFAVRLVVANPSEPVLVLNAVPIALLALEAGRRGASPGRPSRSRSSGFGPWSRT